MSPEPQTRVGPITSAERILYLDILRGMALFGILAANMRGFNAPVELYGNIKVLFHGTADLIAQGFIDIRSEFMRPRRTSRRPRPSTLSRSAPGTTRSST